MPRIDSSRRIEPSDNLSVGIYEPIRSPDRIHLLCRAGESPDQVASQRAHQSLIDAGQFIRVIEERQSLKVACPEEIAWRMGFITGDQLAGLAAPLKSSGYGQYLLQILEDPQ